MKNKFLAIFLIFIWGGIFVFPVNAFEIKETYPRTANYYLQPLVPENDYDALSKYDLLILDIDTQTIDASMFDYLEEKNEDIKFLAYIPSQSVNTQDLSSWARWRRLINEKVSNNDWWLRDSNNEIISFSDIWPTIKFVNPGENWSDYLSDLIADDAMQRDIWDGIFYDMVFANLSWLNHGDIDIDNDGEKESVDEINEYWRMCMNELIKQTKEKIDSNLLIANVDMPNYYGEELNGLMMENFPVKWMGENSWSILMDYYLNNLPKTNLSPQIYIINANTENTGTMNNFRKVRFGLTSALLGDGYFSFDYGDESHAQTWWYDEYDVSLGKAQSGEYNLLGNGDQVIKPGLWRRDFENGIALINSTDQKQTYVFNNEEFEYINGTQDRRMNNGSKTNWINLESKDGVVLLKINKEIKNDIFNNGVFVRVFSDKGEQTRNGFFTFKDGFLGNSNILISDIDGDGIDEVLTDEDGVIYIYKNGEKTELITPYPGYKGKISFDSGDINSDGKKEIITGAGSGSEPYVKIFSDEGIILSEFMAYDQRFFGGVNIAIGDVNSDGEKEIITGAGSGGGSHVKIFSENGETLNEFMAYNKEFHGGVNIAIGDVNSDGKKEIITGAGSGGGPHVKIFSDEGIILNEFMAYDEKSRDGIIIMSDDLDNNNIDEILVGLIGV